MIQISDNWNSIPQTIKDKLNKANLFYSLDYWSYITKKHPQSPCIYLYDADFIQIARIINIKVFFKIAVFDSELFCITTEERPEKMQIFLDECVEHLSAVYNIDWATATQPHLLFKAYPTKSIRIPFGNYIIDLQEDLEVIYSRFSKSNQRNIKQAIRDGATVKFGREELLDDYVSMAKELWKRNGQQIDPEEEYRQLLTGLRNNVLIGMVYKNGVPQCGRFCDFNSFMCYNMRSATGNNMLHGASNYLHFEYMKKMKEMGVHYYNFVGCRINVDPDSKYAKLQEFKSKFGGTLEECYMFKVIVHPYKFKMFNILLKLKHIDFKGDILEQELHKWKELNQRNTIVPNFGDENVKITPPHSQHASYLILLFVLYVENV